ncbi:hypothetical protein OTK59_23890 [Vibrio natriegens]|uniref:hypothetical protein n=1 Tax=Vibrio natriegens TaxID=691 RepID=UPI0008047287|nr:hypothetical protein [Vibrio natriegens]ANQ26490.1 hypothetical protein BA894_08510 [Vibrio natriegens]MCY9879589.1 hypothetical protein [Vibrio natriegens]
MIFKSHEEIVSEYHIQNIINNIKNGNINISTNESINNSIKDNCSRVDLVSKKTSLNRDKGSLFIESAVVIYSGITGKENKAILIIDVKLSDLKINNVEIYDYESNKTKYETIVLSRNQFF